MIHIRIHISQILALECVRGIYSAHSSQCRENIHEFYRCADYIGMLLSGIMNDQGCTACRFIVRGLAPESLLAGMVTMVAQQDHYGIIVQSCLFQFADQDSYILVDI